MNPTATDARNSAVIFTNKPPVPHPAGGSLIGCGYLFSLENEYAYASARIAVPTNFRAQAAQDVLLVAHEIGHNFGGLHERAFPDPDGPFDVATCTGATVMYPFLCRNAPAFSDVPLLPADLGSLGVVRDGGNAPWMEEYAFSRI